jgi:hypothetical protein
VPVSRSCVGRRDRCQDSALCALALSMSVMRPPTPFAVLAAAWQPMGVLEMPSPPIPGQAPAQHDTTNTPRLSSRPPRRDRKGHSPASIAPSAGAPLHGGSQGVHRVSLGRAPGNSYRSGNQSQFRSRATGPVSGLPADMVQRGEAPRRSLAGRGLGALRCRRTDARRMKKR